MQVSLRKKWYIDSGCSKHMTGDASNFTHISPKKSGHVTYGDHNKGRILGVGKIGTNSSNSIENVLLVEGLKHSLLKLKFEKDKLCDACQKGKQTRVSFKSKNVVSTTRPLQLLHMHEFWRKLLCFSYS